MKKKAEAGEGHLGGFVTGIVLGTLLGVLMAPDAGKKTRARLERKTRPLRKKVQATPIYKEVSEAIEMAVKDQKAVLKEKAEPITAFLQASSKPAPTKKTPIKTTSRQTTSKRFFRGVPK